MDFGVFNLMGYRDEGKSSAEIIHEAVEQTRLGDELGYGAAWFAEHHFSNYCICPSPLMMAAHCARITKNIKLATGVIILPLYSPARLLSEIAIVDAMCEGRLVLGLGSGYQPYEFDRFGVDLSDSKPMMREFIDILEAAFSEDFFSHSGQFYSLPRTHVSMRLAHGFPQVWVGGDSDETYRLAARKGFIPIFSGRTDGVEGLMKTRARCAAAFEAEGVDPAAMPLGMLRPVCVTSSPDEARRYAENVRYQLRLAGSLRRREEIMTGTMLVDRPIVNDPDIDQILATLPIGDVETVAERLAAEIGALRPEHISVYFQLGDTPHRVAMNSIEKLATDVVPLIEKEIGPLARIGVQPPSKYTPKALAAQEA